MASPVHGEHRRRLRGKSRFSPVYAAMLLLSLHWSIVTYINSTFLEQFISTQAIGTLYIIGSALTVISFLTISRVLNDVGNYQLTLGLAIAEVAVLLGMTVSSDMRLVIPLFIAHHAIVPLLLFNLDVFMEGIIGHKESHTGSKRGLLLTVMSIAGAVAPLIAGFLVGDGTPRFFLAYIASALLMLPFMWVIVKNLKHFSDPAYRRIDVLSSFRYFWTHRDLRFVFGAHFLLQLFFAWMGIYTPLYLATIIGFGWNEIGLIIFVALLAYVVLEFPIGEVADRYIGEKEMMATGFLIVAISTVWLGFISTSALVPWMVTMFLTRVGASLVETTSESYFFKHTEGSDANIIGFFRITRPLAYIAGAGIGSLALLSFSFAGLFIFLGLLMLLGIPLALLLHDTK
jgi:MFS family permease